MYKLNSNLHKNFIDFKEAFDSIDRNWFWKILSINGFFEKLVNYQKSKAQVIVNNTPAEVFHIKTGIKQGCMLSRMFLLNIID